MKYLLALLALALPIAQAAEVNVYSARKEALIKPLFERFTAASGIDVNMVTGKADALIKRMELEGKNSPADLLITVDVGRLYRAQQAGVLQPVQSALLTAAVPANYRDPQGYWYGLSLRSRVIVYDRARVSPAELHDYEDLADSKWHKQICVRSSSNIYNQSLVASLIAHNGPGQARAWADGLVSNFARSPKGGDRDQIKAVAAGQCKLALVNTYYLAGMLSSKIKSEAAVAAKVDLFWPNQTNRGTHINISGASVTASAKNREAAIRLLEFLLSDASQKWYADTNHEFPVKAGIGSSAILNRWGEFKADTLPLAALGEGNAAAVKIMDRAGWK
ncbi:MAG: Fe(3+) ABC transporter substrate-binding protein [Gammaproteobacteria bacterium]